MNRLITLLILISLCTASSTEKGFHLFQNAIACYNPLGCLFDTRLNYRTPLIKKKGILWESTKLDIGIQNEWTPADNFIGCRVHIEPIAFFDIFARVGYYAMYNNIVHGYYGFKDKNTIYNEESLEKVQRENEQGYFWGISPTLKGKIGKVICSNTLHINHFSLNTHEYFLELRTYSLHYSDDTHLLNESFLLFEVNKKIMAGLNSSMLRVITSTDRSRKINGVFIYKPEVNRIHDMFLVVLAGMYTTDRLYENNFFGAVVFGFEVGMNNEQ